MIPSPATKQAAACGTFQSGSPGKFLNFLGKLFPGVLILNQAKRGRFKKKQTVNKKSCHNLSLFTNYPIGQDSLIKGFKLVHVLKEVKREPSYDQSEL